MKKQLQLFFLFLICSTGVKALNTLTAYSLGTDAMHAAPTYSIYPCTTTISAPSVSCNTTFTLSGNAGGNTGNFALVYGTGTLVDHNDGTASYTPGPNEGEAIIRFVNNAEDGCTSHATATATIITTTPPTPTVITGPAPVCANSQDSYTVAASKGASTYNWTFPSGCSTVSGGGTSIVEQFGSASGNISVTAQNACGTSSAVTLSVTVNTVPAAPSGITGSTLLCSNANTGINYSIAPIATATAYVWTMPAGGSITSGNGTNAITANFGAVGGIISVAATNSCGISSSASVTLVIDTMPANPGVITGVGSVCPGQTGVSYSVVPVTHATSYVWTLPTGATIATGNNTNVITVNYSAGASSGNVYVSAANPACLSGVSPALLVTVNQIPVAPGPIVGASNVCLGQSNISYSVTSVSNATSYNWSLPAGATINSGLNTNIITVNYSGSAVNGNISVYGLNGVCAGNSSVNFAITVSSIPTAPSSISGNNSTCVGSSNNTYSVSSVGGVTYNWSVPTGGTITSSNPSNSNSITVSYANNATTGNISVSNTNACGTGPASTFMVTLNLLPNVTANASNNPVCMGTHITLNGGGANTYTWTGGVTNGVAFPAVNQSYTVTGTDGNGCVNTAMIAISTPPLPSPEICMVSTDSFFVNNRIYWDRTLYPSADSFIVYRLSSGVYLKIGTVSKDSNQVTDVNRNIGGPGGGDPLTSGWYYKLAVKDSCGNISPMSPYHFTVNFQQNNQNLTWNAYAIESPQANPVNNYEVWRDSTGFGDWAVIANVSGLSYNDTHYANYPNSNYRVDATPFSCTSNERLANPNNVFAAKVKAHSNTNNNRHTTSLRQNLANNTLVSIYPNPNNGTFSIRINDYQNVMAEVYNTIGQKIMEQDLQTNLTQLNLVGFVDGMYQVRILKGGNLIYQSKIVKQE